MKTIEVTHRRRQWISAAALCLLSFLIYRLSLAPTITWQHDGVDSGDLATAVAVGGVPHPSGYPTYLILADLFNRLPLGGDVAYRLNLLSALAAAATIGLFSLAAAHTLGCRPVGERTTAVSAAVAALTLAFAPPFWSQAIITEVYTLNGFFVALLLWLALLVRAGAENHLRWLCLATGLALGNHLSVGLVLPFVGILVWPVYRRQNWRRWVELILLALVGLSVYAIIPWRAAVQPPVNWGGADQWSGFRWLATGEAYRGYILGLPWLYAGQRFLALIQMIGLALAWWGLPVAWWGWWLMAQSDRLLAVGSLLTVGLITVYAVGYNTSDSYLYLLPALMLMCLWLAWGVFGLLWPVRAYRPGAWALLLAPLVSMTLNFSTMSLRSDRTALDFAEETLNQATPQALILVDDDRHTFALWYARYALGQRPDVAIVNVNLLSYPWYRASLAKAHPNLALTPSVGELIRRNMAQHPVYAIRNMLALPGQFVLETIDETPGIRTVNITTQ